MTTIEEAAERAVSAADGIRPFAPVAGGPVLSTPTAVVSVPGAVVTGGSTSAGLYAAAGGHTALDLAGRPVRSAAPTMSRASYSGAELLAIRRQALSV